ncbi:hypothetical protein P3T36_005675 [Kitasatospora sp. MAP12-15]|uniref:hypothetical protein n=1 Tax=unclassified Kitasatospora TaxID=2633591 RepID=UPI002475E30C|nr:hypothetical protein [Kitasatospora sp. MAP12-44]MDH6113813.1 hypothetical protein [Kitasatospora sp. MAP12-44]
MRELLDGSGDITGFLASWYGPPDRPSADARPGSDRLPPALRTWYRIASGYSRPVLFNHRIVPAAELSEDDSLFAFCADDFGWQDFGVAPGGGDPLVHHRLVDEDAGWEPNDQGLRLSQFLPAILLHETVHGARFTASADKLTLQQSEQLLAPLRRLDGPELFTAQYAAGHELLAAAWPDEGGWSVRLAARTEALLGHAEAVPQARFGPGEWYPGEWYPGDRQQADRQQGEQPPQEAALASVQAPAPPA